MQNDKALNADMKAQQWLAKANELREKGRDDSYAMKQAQKWLDRLNTLEGLGDEQEAK